MYKIVGSLTRDVGLGLFTNGLFTVTQNGFSFNNTVTIGISVWIIVFGLLIHQKGVEYER